MVAVKTAPDVHTPCLPDNACLWVRKTSLRQILLGDDGEDLVRRPDLLGFRRRLRALLRRDGRTGKLPPPSPCFHTTTREESARGGEIHSLPL